MAEAERPQPEMAAAGALRFQPFAAEAEAEAVNQHPLAAAAMMGSYLTTYATAVLEPRLKSASPRWAVMVDLALWLPAVEEEIRKACWQLEVIGLARPIDTF